MTTTRPRDPLLLPLFGLAAGIATASWTPLSLQEASIATGLTAIPWVAAMRSNSRRAVRAFAGLALYFFCGTLADSLHRKPSTPKLDAASGEWVLLAGCVIEPPVFNEDRGRFLLELEPGAIAQITVYTKDGESPPAIRYGQRVEVEARVRTPRNFRNPGAFDYQSHLARRDIHWLGSTHTSPKIDIMPGSCGTPWGRAIAELRTRALDRLAALYPNDAYTEGMMAAVLTGQTQRIDRIWTEDFRRTGTYHALVVSGMHFTAIVGLLSVVVWLTRSGRGLHLAAVERVVGMTLVGLLERRARNDRRFEEKPGGKTASRTSGPAGSGSPNP